MNYEKISEKTVKNIYAAHTSLAESPLEQKLRYLVELRVSQLNGCAFCCAVHSKEARKAGISEVQLDELPAWQYSSRFNAREKLVLAWGEAVTLSSSNQAELKPQLLSEFDEREFVDLTLAISLMNALNRMAITLRD